MGCLLLSLYRPIFPNEKHHPPVRGMPDTAATERDIPSVGTTGMYIHPGALESGCGEVGVSLVSLSPGRVEAMMNLFLELSVRKEGPKKLFLYILDVRVV